MKEYRFKIIGMKCEGCLEKVKKALGSHPGIKNLEIDLSSGKGHLEAEDYVKESDIVDSVMGVGFAYLPL